MLNELQRYCIVCHKIGANLAYVSHVVDDTVYGQCADCRQVSCVDCGNTYPMSDMKKGHSLTGVAEVDNYICIPCDNRARDEEE